MRKPLLVLACALLVMLSCSLPFVPGAASTPSPETNLTAALPTETAAMPTSSPPPATAVPSEEPPAPAVQYIEKRVAEEGSDPLYKVSAGYPYLEGVPRAVVFNQGVEAYIQGEVQSFKDGLSQLEGEWRQVESVLEVRYTVTYQSASLFSVLFQTYFMVAGAAHPGASAHSMNYDVALGRFLELPELFMPNSGFLEILSGYCGDSLAQQGLETWPEGLEPTVINFENWNVQPDSLLITFPPYQVAPGAAGTLQVAVPLQELNDVVRPDGPLAPLLQ